ncbi:hypothetical protein HY623_01400 [Candidatus Uhrbacteria bacterium]|nr:hypothetical protein [Candidatus Uhrbacteria bacterium]
MSEKTRKFEKAVVALGAVGALQFIQQDARAESVRHPVSQQFELTYQEREGGEPIIIRFQSPKNFGHEQADETVDDHPLIRKMKETDVFIHHVNGSILDRKQFRASIIERIPSIKQRLRIPEQNISPRESIKLGEYIIKQDLRYDYSSVYPSDSDARKRSEIIDITPVDQLRGKGVVCRHAAVYFSKTLEEIIQSEAQHSPQVRGMSVDELSGDVRHALNSVHRIYRKDGKTIFEITPIDITPSERKEFRVDTEQTVTKPAERILSFLRLHIFPFVSSEYIFASLRSFFSEVMPHDEKLYAVNEAYEIYRDSVEALKKNAHHEIPSLFSSAVLFFDDIHAGAVQKKDWGIVLAVQDVLYQIFRSHANDFSDVNKALAIYKDRIAQTASSENMRQIHAYSCYGDALRRYGRPGESLDAMERAYIISRMVEYWKYHVEIGMAYADFLGDAGMRKEALAILRELFEYFQKLPKNGALAIGYHNEIYENGEYKKIEPFASRENFERYVEHKKRGWESKAKSRD